MSNITISLPDRLKSYIDAQVAQGGYARVLIMLG